jgi:hypothetical protein
MRRRRVGIVAGTARLGAIARDATINTGGLTGAPTRARGIDDELVPQRGRNVR